MDKSQIVTLSERSHIKRRVHIVWFHVYKILKTQTIQSIMTESQHVYGN